MDSLHCIPKLCHKDIGSPFNCSATSAEKNASRPTIDSSELLDIALALSTVAPAPMEVLDKHGRNGEVMVDFVI